MKIFMFVDLVRFFKSNISYFLGGLVFMAVITSWLIWGMFGPNISRFFLGLNSIDVAFCSGVEDVSGRAAAFTEAGQWGDAYGSLNTLFSGLAFTGAIVALFMQGKSIRKQNKDSHIQRFESTFFELLKMLKDARGEVEFRYSAAYRSARSPSVAKVKELSRTGHSAFRAAIYELRHWMSDHQDSMNLTKNQMAMMYSKRIHTRFENTFGPYFRLMYTILRKISDDKILNEDEKIIYGNLLRSQLTSNEIALAAFNGLTARAKDFDALLTEFHMIKYYPLGIIRRNLERFYPESAFTAR